MKTYRLSRTEDVSGMSGVGNVAQVAEFDDGSIAVRWIANRNATGVASTTVFSSLDDMLKVHGHDGRTTAEVIFDETELQDAERRLFEIRHKLGAAVDLLKKHGIAYPPEWDRSVDPSD